MSETGKVVRELLKRIVQIEVSSTSGKLNLAFGLLIGLMVVVLFAASLLESIADIILAFFEMEGTWNPWAALAGLGIAVVYFLGSVYIVARLGRG